MQWKTCISSQLNLLKRERKRGKRGWFLQLSIKDSPWKYGLRPLPPSVRAMHIVAVIQFPGELNSTLPKRSRRRSGARNTEKRGGGSEIVSVSKATFCRVCAMRLVDFKGSLNTIIVRIFAIFFTVFRSETDKPHFVAHEPKLFGLSSSAARRNYLAHYYSRGRWIAKGREEGRRDSASLLAECTTIPNDATCLYFSLSLSLSLPKCPFKYLLLLQIRLP